MRLVLVLLPCVSESFSAVDFFQKYSALKIKGFSHLRWTLDGYSALVIGLVLFCYAMRNILRFPGLKRHVINAVLQRPAPHTLFFNLFAIANFAHVLPVRTLIIRLQASMRCIYCTSCSLCSENTPHLRQNARGGAYKKIMEPV
jgi:hypothetical protein